MAESESERGRESESDYKRAIKSVLVLLLGDDLNIDLKFWS